MSIALEQFSYKQVGFAVVLALIAGYVDAFALLNFDVYASFMSGNTTQSGLRAGQGHLLDAARHLLPIPLFVVGVFVGTFLQGDSRRSVRRHCFLVAACLAISIVMGYCGPISVWCNIILLSLGMGVLNTMITHVGKQPVSLGFVSGDLNNIGRHLALAARGAALPDSETPSDTHARRAAVLAGVWASFLSGAVLSGGIMLFISKWIWILLPPIVALLLLGLCQAPQVKLDRHRSVKEH
jgi:uncharacterized membrane protein YoaK (UPF0700 family)